MLPVMRRPAIGSSDDRLLRLARRTAECREFRLRIPKRVDNMAVTKQMSTLGFHFIAATY